MSKSQSGAPAAPAPVTPAKPVTARHEFYKNGDGYLFSVNEGIPLFEALQIASVFLKSAEENIVACVESDGEPWAGHHAIQFADAVINASVYGLRNAGLH